MAVELSQRARRGLQIASVLDGAFTVEELCGLTGSPPAEVAAVTEEAAAAGILDRTGALLEFRHPPTRRSISGTLTAAVRRSLRRRAVDVRLARGERAADVAALLAETADPGDHRAVELLRAAAAELAAAAPAEAAALSRRALDLSGPTGPHTPEIVGETVELLGRDGRYAEARALADMAFAGYLAPEAEARLRSRVARLAGCSSSVEAVRHCRIALALPGLPGALRARLAAVQALHLARMGDAVQAVTASERAMSEWAGQDPGPDVPVPTDVEATTLTAGSRVELSRLNLDLAFRLQDRAESLAARSEPPPWAARSPAVDRAFLRTASGQVGEALREAGAGLRDARRAGDAVAAHLWSMTRVRVLLDAGRLAAARAEAGAVLASAGGPGSGDLLDGTARYALGRAAVHLGDREGIRRCAADGARMTAAEAPAVRRTGAWLAALAADALGETARVAGLVERAWADARTRGPLPGAPPDPADHVVLVRLALRAGLPGLAADAAERAADLGTGFPLLRGIATHARGLVDDDPDLLLQAVELLQDTERPLVLASAAEDAGRVHGAPDLLETALDRYEEAGAARDAARVRRRLRLLGVRRRPRPASGAEQGRWGLTAAELAVVRLVAEGATNRQVAEQLSLSPHTVGGHLRNVFTKWGINSRVDLARIMADIG